MENENLILDKNLMPPGILDIPGAQGDISPGPFYIWAWGANLHRVQSRDSCPHVWNCQVATVTKFGHWEPQLAMLESSGRTHEKYMPSGDVEVTTLVEDQVGGQVESILKQYGWNSQPHENQGTILIEAFTERLPAEIDVARFNSIIQPFPLQRNIADLAELQPSRYEAWKRVPQDLHDLCASKGGLFARVRQVELARDQILDGQIALTPNRKAMYLDAISEIMLGVPRFRAYATAYLDASDSQIRQQTKESKPGAKSMYDDYDLDLQWLMARKGVDDILTRLAANTNGGVTADQLREILNVAVPTQQQSQVTPEMLANIVAQVTAAVIPGIAKSIKDSMSTEPEPVNGKKKN